MRFVDDYDFYSRLILNRQYDSDDERGKEEKNRCEELRKERLDAEEKREQEYELLSKSYKDLVDIWRGLTIGHHFTEYEFNKERGEFSCQISKKVTDHETNLRQDYETFLKDIIAPISSEIWDCQIESDDYSRDTWQYSDSELRNIYFRLEDKIKYVEHEYNDTHTEIVETRVVYKHSIKTRDLLDLNRAYGFRA